MNLGTVAKELSVALVAAGGSLLVGYDDGRLTTPEIIAAGIAFIGTGVITKVISPWAMGTYGKAITGGVLATLSVIGTALMDGGLSTPEVIKAITDGLIGTGLLATSVPNATASDVYRIAP